MGRKSFGNPPLNAKGMLAICTHISTLLLNILLGNQNTFSYLIKFSTTMPLYPFDTYCIWLDIKIEFSTRPKRKYCNYFLTQYF